MTKVPEIEVVKADGTSEPFNVEKIVKSLHAACLSAGGFEGEAQDIAKIASKEVWDWVEEKKVITTKEIRSLATEILENYSPDAAYLYQTYKKII